jgi:hypothetical protein
VAARPRLARENGVDDFRCEDGALHCGSVPLEELAAEYGTPVYAYSRSTLRGHLAKLCYEFAALDPLLCYAWTLPWMSPRQTAAARPSILESLLTTDHLPNAPWVGGPERCPTPSSLELE